MAPLVPWEDKKLTSSTLPISQAAKGTLPSAAASLLSTTPLSLTTKFDIHPLPGYRPINVRPVHPSRPRD